MKFIFIFILLVILEILVFIIVISIFYLASFFDYGPQNIARVYLIIVVSYDR